MRRLLPAPAVELSDDAVRAAYGFPDDRRWVRANMVATLDGSITGPDGSSRSISSPADQRLFSMARLAADVVLVGAGTVRTEDYRPSRRPIAVVTGTLDLPRTLRLFAERTSATPRTIVLTTDAAADRAPAELREVADVVPCGAVSVDLATALDALAARGLARVHCEGGPRLLGSLVSAGLLDELLLTVSPLLLGSSPAEHLIDLPGGLPEHVRLRPEEVYEEDGTVFLRARRP
jgi:riboflavin-specific deaminase-like protein